MIPVVLCGGSGTRLWPLSRRSFPKQFSQILDRSLLAKTLGRVQPLGEPWVVAVRSMEVLTRKTLGAEGLDPDRGLFEPAGRNTAPAVALAVRKAQLEDRGDEILGIFPADHLVEDEAAFRRAVELAALCADQGKVVTLGIRPDSAATGYGYIEVTERVLATHAEDPDLTARATRGFREKPDQATAETFLSSGNFLWNAGMFVFRAEIMAACFERLMPELWEPLLELRPDLSNLEPIYERLPSESLDYGIMEHLEDELVSIPCDIGWSDLGSWDEVARVRDSSPNAFEVGASENFVLGYRDKVYGLVGVDDLVVVDTGDATLVTRRGASQGVKRLVERLREADRPQADEHLFEHRPWGSFEVLRDTEKFKSKILRVSPGQRLSYQSHRHRAEHWVIVQGHPEITLDGEVLRPEPGQAVYIPRGAKHRIANPGDQEVEIVEVQVGTYFGEDDIVRYEDDYDRD